MRLATTLPVAAVALLFAVSLTDRARAQATTTQPEGEAQPPTPALVPPKLKQFAEATYPPGAAESGLTAEVILQLDIDAEGKVTAVSVKQLAGGGFDTAAAEAAYRFVFEPALREGQPVASRILYAYRFELKPAPAPVAAAEPPAAMPARLQGIVRMAGEDAPMPGARVTVRDAKGAVLEVVADENGRWSVSELPAGEYRVAVEASGFTTYQGRETLKPGEQVDVVYRVSPEGGPLEVTVRGARPDREVTRRTIERAELARVPGTSGDALRAVQTMPGVARAMALSGEIAVRGSSPSGTSVYIDGAWVPNVYHFGGLSSVVPTEMIESLDFYPGNFSARYGRVMGGVIDVKTRELDPNGGYHGLAQVDLIDARVMAQGPVPGLKGWSFVLGGRRSHLDAWLPSVLESADLNVRAAPVYYDYQGFVETKPTPKSRFRFGVFGSDDRFALTFNEGFESDPGFAGGFSMRSSFWRLAALYRNQISDDLSVALDVAYGRMMEQGEIGSMMFDTKYHTLSVRGDVEIKLIPELVFRAGPDFLYYPYDIAIRAPQPPRPGEPDPGPFASRPMLQIDSQATFSGPAGFAELEWKPSSRWKLLFGGRADYFNANEQWDFSPRFNARYDVRETFPRTTLKTGVGVFYEIPNGVEVVEPYGNPRVNSNRATHYSLGVEQELAEHLELSVEGFYKDLDDLIVRTNLPDGAQSYENIGSGKVYGAETLLRYKYDGKFFAWLAYTLSRSTRRDGPNVEERMFEMDQTHILTALASYDIGRGWAIGSRFRYVSGNLYTPCEGGVYDAASGAYGCRSGEPYSKRLPAFHQLDVRVDKTWSFEAWKLTAYLDVQNIYNRQNPETISYNYNYTQSEHATGLPIIPNLGVRGEF